MVIPIADKHDGSGNVILDGNVLLGNIICVSKARLGDFVATLEASEMDAVDEAIAISIDIKRHYDKLNNIHKDKLIYIDKLKEKIKDMDKELNRFNTLKDELGLENMEKLENEIRKLILKKPVDKKET